jgi:hypothetical protein
MWRAIIKIDPGGTADRGIVVAPLLRQHLRIIDQVMAWWVVFTERGTLGRRDRRHRVVVDPLLQQCLALFNAGGVLPRVPRQAVGLDAPFLLGQWLCDPKIWTDAILQYLHHGPPFEKPKHPSMEQPNGTTA